MYVTKKSSLPTFSRVQCLSAPSQLLNSGCKKQAGYSRRFHRWLGNAGVSQLKKFAAAAAVVCGQRTLKGLGQWNAGIYYISDVMIVPFVDRCLF
ncbi:hypothetical protein CEXT_175421 [Caerostris extrusa]|uniref:Uncharacterized protein n=1 Tax=Caerostris extrusa TaxID=172846 RepID=A0AAV4NF40_CAEEX|nr:hypothetical protein CEXT_175421 [Caerostris extrusa]